MILVRKNLGYSFLTSKKLNRSFLSRTRYLEWMSQEFRTSSGLKRKFAALVGYPDQLGVLKVEWFRICWEPSDTIESTPRKQFLQDFDASAGLFIYHYFGKSLLGAHLSLVSSHASKPSRTRERINRYGIIPIGNLQRSPFSSPSPWSAEVTPSPTHHSVWVE